MFKVSQIVHVFRVFDRMLEIDVLQVRIVLTHDGLIADHFVLV